MENVYGIRNSENTVDILAASDGSAITRIDANVYPVGSTVSARYEHPAGIKLTAEDCAKLGIEIQD